MQWQKPILNNHTILNLTSNEITPFLWKNRIYLVENFHRHTLTPCAETGYRFHEDGCFIRDVETGTVLAYPWLNHYFSTVNVFNDKLIIIGGDYEWDRPWWHIRNLQLMVSDNLTTWSKPETIFQAEPNENIFNNAIVFNGSHYVLLYETDDKRWAPKFTFRFAISDDLIHWKKLPEDYIYGIGKYVGAPSLYFCNGMYYLLYLSETYGKYGHWTTRLTRSNDLKNWEDAPTDRPFLIPDESHETDPIGHPGTFECNVSDLELIEYQGHVKLWWNGGDQRTCADLQYAIFDGTLSQLFKAYYND